MPLNKDALSVFPIWPVVDGKCGCGNPDCKTKPGKHPQFSYSRLEAGQKVKGTPGCNYGIATGSRSGFFVVDLDGEAAISWWEEHGDFDTYCVETSKGFHLYYQLPDFSVKSSGSQLAPGIDIRGEQNAMVVAPGSVHVSGFVYREVDAEANVAPAPAWLLEWPGLRGTGFEAREASGNAPVPVDVESERGQRHVELAVEHLKALPPGVEGQGGGTQMFQASLHAVRVLQLPLDVAADLIMEHYSPRCEPPWPLDLVMHKLEDARDKSDLWPGIIPSDEEWAALCKRMKTASLGLKPGMETTRRQHDPAHVYTFRPGKDISLEEPQPTLAVNIANTLTTHAEWNGVLQWDSFRDRVIAVDPPFPMEAEKHKVTDMDLVNTKYWLEAHGKKTSKEDVMDAMKVASRCTPFHPIIEYLESCRAARVEGILTDLAKQVFGTPGEFEQLFLRKTLIAAVRRIYEPGCKVDTVLVLKGDQGAKKTTLVETLFGKEFVRSQMPDLAGKDASIALKEFWAVELSELDKVLKSDSSTVKEFLTRVYDDYRPPHGINDVRFPRHTVFIGTTNEADFLKDATGSRRFWPIEVNMINIEYVEEHRDSIWGEALHLAESGEIHWFEDEKVLAPVHEVFIAYDAWHEAIMGYCKGKPSVSVQDIFVSAISNGGSDLTKFDRASQMRIADTLKRLGCKMKRSGGQRRYQVPDELRVLDHVKGNSMADRLNGSKPS